MSLSQHSKNIWVERLLDFDPSGNTGTSIWNEIDFFKKRFRYQCTGFDNKFERLTYSHSSACSRHRAISRVRRLISSADCSPYSAGEESDMQKLNGNDSAYPSLFQSENKRVYQLSYWSNYISQRQYCRKEIIFLLGKFKNSQEVRPFRSRYLSLVSVAWLAWYSTEQEVPLFLR